MYRANGKTSTVIISHFCRKCCKLQEFGYRTHINVGLLYNTGLQADIILTLKQTFLNSLCMLLNLV